MWGNHFVYSFWHIFLVISMPNIDVEQCDAKMFIYLRKQGLTFKILIFQF